MIWAKKLHSVSSRIENMSIQQSTSVCLWSFFFNQTLFSSLSWCGFIVWWESNRERAAGHAESTWRAVQESIAVRVGRVRISRRKSTDHSTGPNVFIHIGVWQRYLQERENRGNRSSSYDQGWNCQIYSPSSFFFCTHSLHVFCVSLSLCIR